MNIYFTAALNAKDRNLPKYSSIIQHCTKMGHTIIADHIVSASEEMVNNNTREQRMEFHKKIELWLRNCDFVIAEASSPSISVGYEIFQAIEMGKPVLILYTDTDPPSLFTHQHNERIVCERYTSDTLAGLIEDFILYIEGKHDMRFTFFITPQISEYLDVVAKRRRIPKSQYIRDLIYRELDAASEHSL